MSIEAKVTTRLLECTYSKIERSKEENTGGHTENHDFIPEPERGTKVYLIASIICFIASFVRALSMATSQVLDNSVGVLELNLFRFGSMNLIVIPMYFFKRCPSMLVSPKQIIPIIVMALFYFGMNVTTYAAATYIAVGTSNVIAIISFMIITLITSIINSCLSKSQWKWRPVLIDISCITLLCIGVFFLIQPVTFFDTSTNVVTYKSYCNKDRFGDIDSLPTMKNTGFDIVPNSNYSANFKGNFTGASNGTCVTVHINNSNTTTYCATYTVQDLPDIPSWKGYIFSVAGGAFNSFRVTAAKRIFEKEDNHVVAIWMALFNTLLSVICTAIFETFSFPEGLICVSSLIGYAVTTGTMTLLTITVMNWIPSTDFSFIYSFTPLFLFVFQFTFLANNSPTPAPQNGFAISAAVFMSAVILGKPIYEIVYHSIQQKYQNK